MIIERHMHWSSIPAPGTSQSNHKFGLVDAMAEMVASFGHFRSSRVEVGTRAWQFLVGMPRLSVNDDPDCPSVLGKLWGFGEVHAVEGDPNLIRMVVTEPGGRERAGEIHIVPPCPEIDLHEPEVTFVPGRPGEETVVLTMRGRTATLNATVTRTTVLQMLEAASRR
jgi:hypothetical protein